MQRLSFQSCPWRSHHRFSLNILHSHGSKYTSLCWSLLKSLEETSPSGFKVNTSLVFCTSICVTHRHLKPKIPRVKPLISTPHLLPPVSIFQKQNYHLPSYSSHKCGSHLGFILPYPLRIQSITKTCLFNMQETPWNTALSKCPLPSPGQATAIFHINASPLTHPPRISSPYGNQSRWVLIETLFIPF